jgi:hypothetical protein
MASYYVTLYLENQKNGQRGHTIHHTAVLGSWFCHVKALDWRVSNITSQGLGCETPLSCVTPGSHVLSKHIVATVREASRLIGLRNDDYSLHQIRAHLSQASGYGNEVEWRGS